MVAAESCVRSAKRVFECVADTAIVIGGAWLIYSAVIKLSDRSSFRIALIEHNIVPNVWIEHVVDWFPVIELAAGALVVIIRVAGFVRRPAAVMLSVFFTLLAAYVWKAYLWQASGKAGCGCSGASSPIVSWLPLVVQNFSLSLAFMVAAIVPSRDGPVRIQGKA